MSRITRASTVLVKARDLIETRGWCRGLFEKAGRLCMAGAIAVASGLHAEERPALGTPHREAGKWLEDCVGRRLLGVWNDAQKSRRTVLAAFDKAIALAKHAERKIAA